MMKDTEEYETQAWWLTSTAAATEPKLASQANAVIAESFMVYLTQRGRGLNDELVRDAKGKRGVSSTGPSEKFETETDRRGEDPGVDIIYC